MVQPTSPHEHRNVIHTRAELHALAEDPELYHRVFAGLGHGVVLLSPDGWIIDVNDTHLDQVGRTREELVGNFSPVYTHPDDLERLFALMVSLVRGERSEIRTTYRFVDGNGFARSTNMTARMIDVSDNGSIVAIAYEPIDERVAGIEPVDAEGEPTADMELLDDAPLSLFFAHATYALHRRDGTIAHAGTGTARLLGRTNDELVGRRWSDSELGAVLPGGARLTDDRDPVVAAATAGMAELETVRFLRPDGTAVWLSIRSTLTPFRGGEAVVSALTDVTELVQALEQRTRLASIVEATADLIGSFRLDGSCIWLNPSAERTLAVAPADFDLFASLPEGGEVFRAQVLPAVLQDGRWSGELVLAASGTDDARIHIAANVIADRDGEGRTTGWTLVGHDLTEYKALQATLAHKATHDSLTGLPNRALLNDRLSARACVDSAVTVVFVDLDGFKELNDTFGHEFGDDALVEVARRIASVVEGSGFAARYGGDEFVVLPDPSWKEPVADLEEKVFGRPFTVGPILLDITGRMGMATAEPGETPMSLISRADREMYRAKQSRRDTQEW